MSLRQAVRRLVERSGMTEEEAVKRLRSQMSSESRVSRANVVLCTLWHPDVTQKQVRDYATQQLEFHILPVMATAACILSLLERK